MSLHALYDLMNAKAAAFLAAVWNWPLPVADIVIVVSAAAALIAAGAVISRISRPLP